MKEAKYGMVMNATQIPQVVHVGAEVPLCSARYREHFALHPWQDAPGFPGRDATALIAKAPVTAAMIAALPRLRHIAVYGVGYDKIDREAARARGIAITNTPGPTDGCVADMAFALLLAAARGIAAGDRYVREGRWLQGAFPLMPRIHSRPMGILGMGRIGREIARRAEAFGMPVLYHNSRPVPGVPYAFRDSALALARDCELLMVACPGGEATRHLVNAGVLAALGPRGIVVNIARGTVIDEAALIEALRNRTIAAAGLDVFEHEPQVPAALMALDNAVLMPHRGGGTIETWEECADMVIANLQAHFAGKSLPNPIPDD
jgi:lactate dehydrogenase-like 2-hydroxyacid dehydrogenase